MNTAQRKQTALQIFEDCEVLMGNLQARWQEEKQYENIDDYGPPLALKVQARGGVFLVMHKQPFGFSFRLADGIYRVSMTGSLYGYKLTGRAAVHN